MLKPFIEFRKQRDFSAILTDTFGFIRNEFKPLIKTILNIAGPAVLIFIFTLAAYNYVAGDIFDFSNFNKPAFNSENLGVVIIALIAYVLSAIAAYILFVSTVLFYVKSYVDGNGKIDELEIKSNVYKSFWSFFGMSFLKGVTLGFAFVLCFLPVLYVMIPMAIVFSIYVFEARTSSSEAFSKSFTLANKDFWTAFGAFLVLGIIYYALGLVFSIPTILYSIIGSGVFSGEIDPADLSSFSADPVVILLNVLNTVFQFLLNLILVIGGAIIYFHLNEKTNFTGTYNRINEIGKLED